MCGQVGQPTNYSLMNEVYTRRSVLFQLQSEDRQAEQYGDSFVSDAGNLKLFLLTQEGAFLVRTSAKGGEDQPFTLCVLHKGELCNIPIRIRKDGKFALGSKKDRETVSA